MSKSKTGSAKILVTSALPYVNNIPHLGNILCVVSADAISRYYKMFTNDEVLYICGSDEYGTSTEIKALEEGLTCEEICNKYYAIHKTIYDWFNIDFSYFGRTTGPSHNEISQNIFKKVYDNGYLIEREVEQLYSEDLNMFIADRYVTGTCPTCGNNTNAEQCDCGYLLDVTTICDPKYKLNPEYKLIFKKTNHLFLNLPMLNERLEAFVEERCKTGLWRPNAQAVTKAWLHTGLKPRCITRDNKWGTKIVDIPGYENKVMYNWFDAPIGYISILADFIGEDYKKWFSYSDTTIIQSFSKDNIPFHTIIFPATLLATGDNYNLVHKIASTEYILYNGTKFSKSANNGIFGDTIMELSSKNNINEDYWRYYLFKTRPEVSDTSFTWEIFTNIVNGDLINCIGNLVNRVYSMSSNYRSNVININNVSIYKADFDAIQEKINNYHKYFRKLKLKNAISEVLDLAIYGNAFLNRLSPWITFRKDKDNLEVDNILGVAIHIIQYVGLYLYPFIPKSSAHIVQHVLNFDFGDKLNVVINNNITLSNNKFTLPFKKISVDDFI